MVLACNEREYVGVYSTLSYPKIKVKLVETNFVSSVLKLMHNIRYVRLQLSYLVSL